MFGAAANPHLGGNGDCAGDPVLRLPSPDCLTFARLSNRGLLPGAHSVSARMCDWQELHVYSRQTPRGSSQRSLVLGDAFPIELQLALEWACDDGLPGQFANCSGLFAGGMGRLPHLT
jgi:hypothetical protein